MGTTITGTAGADTLQGTAGNDIIDGLADKDKMYGGKGGDIYIVETAGDQVFENENEGIDLVKSAVSFVLGANVEKLTLTGGAAINGTGNELANVLTGNDADNVLNGGAGADTMIGGKGSDSYYVDNVKDKVVESVSNAKGGGDNDMVNASVDFSLASLANVEKLYLIESAAALKATGNALDNVISGNMQDNVIDGGKGADVMSGAGGDDTYYVDNAGDKVNEAAGNGIDTVVSTIALASPFANVENYTFNTKTAIHFVGTADYNIINGGAGDDTLEGGGSSGDRLCGNAGNDTLIGGSSFDHLDGGAGVDTMTGFGGDDWYYVDNAKDMAIEQMNGGADSVVATVSIAKLFDEVEYLYLQGKGNLNGTGNDSANQIFGNDANNVLDGGAGADRLYGGKGNDTYVVDNAGDKLYENAGEGIDLVKSSVSFALAGDFENLTLTGTGNINGTGNGGNNIITGNDGNNVLNGGAGADTLTGGKGDDVYYVDDAKDKVVESVTNAAGGGDDRVVSTLDFSLASLGNIDDLTLMDGAAVKATGNALDNFIHGNANANVIDGGKGIDHMYGHGGNDVYYVDNIGDGVFESSAEGNDTVISTVALSKAFTEVENYTFNTAAALNFNGSTASNWIEGGSGSDVIHGFGGGDTIFGKGGNDILVGGSGNDTLDGGTGIDTMRGYGDDDIYVVDNVGDTVIESKAEGHDTVNASVSLSQLFDNVEDLVLLGTANLNGTGNAGDNVIWGNAGKNAINGGDGKDELYGGAGDDILTGGKGADTFDFDLSAQSKSGHDTVTDFLKAEDVLQFFGVNDRDGNNMINLVDLLQSVTKVVDHGQGQAVDVSFDNGATITFNGCGTGNVQHLTDFVDSAQIQIAA
jgi:Ca2+-binding RTX toxin-like protein